MSKESREYTQELIKDIWDFITKYKSPIAIIILSIFVLIIIISIIVIVKKRKSRSKTLDKEKSLSENLLIQVIDWVENYEPKNSFLNEQYDKFIRNVCLESDLYKKLFDESIKQEDKDSILYNDMKIIEGNSGLTKIRSAYPLLHKGIEIKNDELYSYIYRYVKKKYHEAETFSLKIKKMNHFKYTDIEEFFGKYKSDRVIEIFERGDSNEMIKTTDSDYEFFFAQMRALDSNFNQIIQNSEEKEEGKKTRSRNIFSIGAKQINKIIKSEKNIDKNIDTNQKQKNNKSSIELISYALEKEIITKDKFQGVVNNFYRKSYIIVDKLVERILQWAYGENKKFCEGENCDHYEQIFSSLLFKIAAQNHESKLIGFIDEFKKQHQENPKNKLSEFFKSKFDSQEIKKIELVDLVTNFVITNAEEAYYFDILLNEQTKLTSIQNDKNKFSVEKIGYNMNGNKNQDGFADKIKKFVESTFNNVDH